MKKYLFLISLILFSQVLFAQTEIQPYTVSIQHGTCRSNGSITITFPAPTSGNYNYTWTAGLVIANSPTAQPQSITVPSTGGNITFNNLTANSYNLEISSVGGTINHPTPLIVNSSYVDMSLNTTSTAPTICKFGTDAKLTINVPSGGIAPFTYTIVSSSSGTQTFTSNNRSYTFQGLTGGEVVTYKVKDACNAEPQATTTVATNTSAGLDFALRRFNFIKDCTNPGSPTAKFYVNVKNADATRLSTLQASGNATVTIKNGATILGTFPLTYVTSLPTEPNAVNAHRFEYIPGGAANGPALQNGWTVEVALNWGCEVLTDNTIVNIKQYSNVFPQTVFNSTDPCLLTNRIRIIGDEDADVVSSTLIKQRNIYFSDPATVVIEKSSNNTNGSYQPYKTSSLGFSLTGRSDVSASITENNVPDGVYRVTISDACNTPVSKVITVATTTPVATISNNNFTSSILEGTGGIYLGSATAGTGFAAIKYPLTVLLERTDNQTSITINPTQPLDIKGSYTITFPKTYTINSNPGSLLYFLDLPLGQYKLTLTDACGYSRTVTVSTQVAGAAYTPSISVNTGCANSNSVTYSLNRNNFSFSPKNIEVRVRNDDGSEGALITSISNNSTSTGTITGLSSGKYYLKYTNVGETSSISVARNILTGPFTYRDTFYIPPYQNIDIDVSTQFCDINNPNSGIVSAQVISGNLVYPLSMTLYSQANPTTAIQGPVTIASPNTSTVFQSVPAGSYFIRTSSACFTFDKNFSINVASTPPSAKVSQSAVCPNSPTTLAVISATNNLYDINWVIKGTNTSVGTGMPVSLSPSTTTTYTAEFSLKSSFGCPNTVKYFSDITVNVTNNPNITDPKVTDIELCKTQNPFVTISNSESGFIYEVLNATGESFSPKATATGNGGNISITVPAPVIAGATLNVISTNGNAGCKGTLTDVIQVIQSTPLLNIDVDGSAVCSGGNGTITLKASETGINYTVLKNGQTLSPTVTGTGTGSDLTLTIPSTNLTGASNEFTIQASGVGCAAGILNERAVITTQQSPIAGSVTNATCNDSNGSITLSTFGGSGNYEYSLDNSTWQSSNTFSGLVPATYTVYSKDMNLSCVTQSSIIVQNDCFTITKTSTTSPNNYDAAGDVLTYSIIVTNTGTSTLTNIQVSDPKATTISSNTITSLAPGASETITATYIVTQSDIDAGSFLNTATATHRTITKSDNETINSITNPALELTKIADQKIISQVGQLITYSFKVKNIGNVTLSNITIVDPMPGLSTISPTNVPSLSPGNMVTFTATYSITSQDLLKTEVVNTAKAIGEYNGNNYEHQDTETITNTQPLPATGLKLMAKWVNNNDAELSWITLTEQNTHYFTIERSIDGINFKTIGVQIKAAGNSYSKQSYLAYDRELQNNNIIYYRIRLFDKDGSSRLSNTVILKRNYGTEIKVYPNPVKNIIYIDFNKTGIYDIYLFGNNGQLIKKINTINIQSGNKTYQIDRGNLLEGSYVIRIQNTKTGELHHTKLLLLQE